MDMITDRLQKLTVADHLINEGCRIILPYQTWAQVQTTDPTMHVAHTEIDGFEVEIVRQTQHSNPFITLCTREEEHCELFWKPLDGTVVVRNVSNQIFLFTDHKSRIRLDPGNACILHAGIWTLATLFGKTNVFFRIIDPYNTDNNSVISRTPLTIARLLSRPSYSMKIIEHLGGCDWRNFKRLAGNSSVYKVHHSKKGVVVVKILWTRGMCTPDGLEISRFVNRVIEWMKEVRILRRLSHVSVAKLGRRGLLTLFSLIF